MKKILLILLLLFITGCNEKKSIPEENNNPTSNIETSINEEDLYIDDNPIKVGLYKDTKLVTNFYTTKGKHKEIVVFNIYYTNIETLDNNNIKYNWNKYYNEYQSIDNYKIGFYITFKVGEKTIERIALDPNSTHAMDPFLYIYLYDDIHQPDGAWYSHLEPNDVNKDTIYSSIKLYLAERGPEITSPISISVFTYDSDDDFNEQGYYRGNSEHTAIINIE